MSICTVKDCIEPIHVKSRGLCRKHYHQAWQHQVLPPRIYDKQEHVVERTNKRKIYDKGLRLLKKAHGYDLFLELQRQNNKCPICTEPFSVDNPPVWDHDHTNGKFRGLLHRTCNLLLGYAKDSEETLLRSIEYLRHQQPTR